MKNKTEPENLIGTTQFPCIKYNIEKFPGEFLNQKERFDGGIFIHCLIILYLSSISALISEFVCIPSLQSAIYYIKIPPDIGKAILLPLSTSSAELISCIIGSFIIDDNVGIWTVIGTSTFNLFGLTSLTILFSMKKEIIKIDYYQITRDFLLNILIVSIVIWILSDGIIHWWEAFILTICFLLYIIMVIFNEILEITIKNKIQKRHANFNEEINAVDHVKSETLKNFGRSALIIDFPILLEEQLQESIENQLLKLKFPKKGIFYKGWWIAMSPAIYLISKTVSVCKKYNYYKLFIFIYIISLILIGGIFYISLWMVTIIGFTYKIPVAIVGIVIFAVGSSIPQIIFGALGIKEISGEKILTNPLQNNLFGILLCLGVPWLIKCLVIENDKKIHINNYTILFSFVILLAITLILLIFIYLFKWKLMWKFATVCLLLYIIFIIITILLQMNEIGNFQPPLCKQQ